MPHARGHRKTWTQSIQRQSVARQDIVGAYIIGTVNEALQKEIRR